MRTGNRRALGRPCNWAPIDAHDGADLNLAISVSVAALPQGQAALSPCRQVLRQRRARLTARFDCNNAPIAIMALACLAILDELGQHALNSGVGQPEKVR